ncbi:MAG: hypothetical protein V4516_07275, partial [Pseudomonadota bacterium]
MDIQHFIGQARLRLTRPQVQRTARDGKHFQIARQDHLRSGQPADCLACKDNGLRNRQVRWLMLAAPFSGGVGIYTFYSMQPYLLQLFNN